MKTNQTNRLAKELSPYLLQHANNPVDWFPWSDEAFEKAIAENKPVFLSIGYSTCHWCHVMERESFEDMAVADILNKHFVSIKVDREERPDIDHVYMNVCLMMNGRGGWPMSLFLTPNKKPFFSGTYFPKNSSGQRIGFIDLLKNIAEAWEQKKSQIELSADEIVQYINKIQPNDTSQLAGQGIIEKSIDYFKNNYDSEYGGFGSSPKFPSLHNILFLLRYSGITGNNDTLQMAVETLTRMRMGGIYDQIGYGIHRYSTDKKWLVPHFEKMLYDQAMAVYVYSEAYHATKLPLFKQTVYEICDYIKREMISAEGLFYSAEDADSEGIEGKYYVWTADELKHILSPHEYKLVRSVFNIEEAGNFIDEFSHKLTGNNILHIADNSELIMEELNLTPDNYSVILTETIEKLLAHRSSRVHPFKDKKYLADWNSMMIAAFAKASLIFEDTEFKELALRVNESIRSYLFDKNDLLLHTIATNRNNFANLDDYAFLIWSQIELHISTQDSKYLSSALSYLEKATELFLDEINGDFFFTSKLNGELIYRSKEFHDGAIPSGNSVMFSNIRYLNFLVNDQRLTDLLNKLENKFLTLLEGYPGGYSSFLSEFVKTGETSEELLTIYDKTENLDPLIKYYRENYTPTVNLYFTDMSSYKQFSTLKYYSPYNNLTTFYRCANYVCQTPANNFESLITIKK